MALKKLTFKEYYDSKQRLIEALNEPAIVESTYAIRKYCKLPLGESKDDKTTVSLKPSHRLIVEWEYQENKPLTLNAVYFDNIDGYDNQQPQKLMWSESKFKKWLNGNTREIFQQ